MALAHNRSGSGEPLVLVHGLGHRRQGWDPVLPLLARERDVVAVDLPGFGESPPLPDGTRATVETLADTVAQTVSELGLGRPHVAGNSLGGAVSLELGLRGAVASVTAISPVGFYCTPRELAFARTSMNLTRKGAGLMEPIGPLVSATALGRTLTLGQIFGRPWRVPAEVAVADSRNLAHCPGYENARDNGVPWMYRDDPASEVPLTIVWGTHDWLLIPRQGRRAERTVPRARMVWLEGLGHTPMWDDPELVARVLLEGSRAATPGPEREPREPARA